MRSWARREGQQARTKYGKMALDRMRRRGEQCAANCPVCAQSAKSASCQMTTKEKNLILFPPQPPSFLHISPPKLLCSLLLCSLLSPLAQPPPRAATDELWNEQK